jgi:hypothetical protein
MPAPNLYFNDASLGTPVVDLNHLKGNLRRFVNAAATVLTLRPGSQFCVERTTLQRVLFEQTLLDLFASCCPKDQYRQVLAGLRPLEPAQIAAALGSRDVRLGGVTCIGATLADLCATEHSIGWIFSVQGKGDTYDVVGVSAERYDLDESGAMVGPQKFELPNVACQEHAAHWRNALHDFGTAISVSARIDEIDGRPIVMYSAPAEHGPPHVHVLYGRHSSETFAKYRFDVFGRELGPPKYDTEMRAWVARNRLQLMRSWDRCQRGLKPFQIGGVPAN